MAGCGAPDHQDNSLRAAASGRCTRNGPSDSTRTVKVRGAGVLLQRLDAERRQAQEPERVAVSDEPLAVSHPA
jgi:hypothetical protein